MLILFWSREVFYWVEGVLGLKIICEKRRVLCHVFLWDFLGPFLLTNLLWVLLYGAALPTKPKCLRQQKHPLGASDEQWTPKDPLCGAGMVAGAYNQELWRQKSEYHWGLLASQSDQLQSSWYSERPYLRQIWWRAIKEDT